MDLDEPPTHGCCTRVVLFIFSVFGMACFVPTSMFWLAVMICLACVKTCLYTCVCDDYGRVYLTSLVWTPCRWLTISCTGRGWIWPGQDAQVRWAAKTGETPLIQS